MTTVQKRKVTTKQSTDNGITKTTTTSTTATLLDLSTTSLSSTTAINPTADVHYSSFSSAPRLKASAQTGFLSAFSGKSEFVFQALILGAICILAFMCRLFSVVRYESVIHEFDPWFNIPHHTLPSSQRASTTSITVRHIPALTRSVQPSLHPKLIHSCCVCRVAVVRVPMRAAGTRWVASSEGRCIPA